MSLGFTGGIWGEAKVTNDLLSHDIMAPCNLLVLPPCRIPVSASRESGGGVGCLSTHPIGAIVEEV